MSEHFHLNDCFIVRHCVWCDVLNSVDIDRIVINLVEIVHCNIFIQIIKCSCDFINSAFAFFVNKESLEFAKFTLQIINRHINNRLNAVCSCFTSDERTDIFHRNITFVFSTLLAERNIKCCVIRQHSFNSLEFLFNAVFCALLQIEASCCNVNHTYASIRTIVREMSFLPTIIIPCIAN